MLSWQLHPRRIGAQCLILALTAPKVRHTATRTSLAACATPVAYHCLTGAWRPPASCKWIGGLRLRLLACGVVVWEPQTSPSRGC